MKANVTRALLLGSGASSPTPSMRCLASGNPCSVCLDACTPQSKNKRSNPSLLVEYRTGGEELEEGSRNRNSTTSTLLIDMGKTFRETYLSFLRNHTILGRTKYNNHHLGNSKGAKLWSPHINSILLTHFHADAILGLDDARELLPKGGQPEMPLYCDAVTLGHVNTMFPYLVPNPNSSKVQAKRWIGSLKTNVIEPYQPFTVSGGVSVPQESGSNNNKVVKATITVDVPKTQGGSIDVIPVPLDHGDCTCYGFILPIIPKIISKKPRNLVYLSDLGSISDQQIQKIKSYGDIDLLFLDCLCPDEKLFLNPSHLGGARSVEAANKLGARNTVMIGMSHACDYSLMSRQFREQVAALGGDTDIDIGYDGAEYTF